MRSLPIDNACPYCATAMQTTQMSCSSCKVAIDAEFSDRPLARLPLEHQRFIELFVLAGGSLKEIAAQAGGSYPTVRSRLDKVIEHLQQEIKNDDSSTGKGRTKRKDQQSAAQILKMIQAR